MESATRRNEQGDCYNHISPSDVTYHSLQSLLYLLCRIAARLGAAFLLRTHFRTNLENVSRYSLKSYPERSSDR